MSTRPEKPLTIHVVSHTHWDREWYQSAGRFRQRLVALIDALLDDHEDRAPFLLDGQAIVLEDYLAVRPERREEIVARLRDGSLEAGPWYVLADELIPSGESLVRNLLVGRGVLGALGAAAPNVLYSPDAFGHPAMLPALAAGFGMPLIVLWRGYGGHAHPAGDVVTWRAPDGSSALVYHLAPDGYELGSSLPLDDADARVRWSALREVLAPRATTSHVLLPNGADHHARQPQRAHAIRALANAAPPDTVKLASLDAFARAIVSAATDAELPEVEGELRDSYGYTWALQGTFATRSALKRRAAKAERSLLRDAEPWIALASHPARESGSPLLRAAWKTLLQCHPHDTLCGCSIDAVARAMAARLEDAELQTAGLREDAIFALIGHDVALARSAPAKWKSSLVVRNAAARARGGVAEVEVLVVRDHVRVGPGSAGDAQLPPGTPAPEWSIAGGTLPTQRLGVERRNDRIESPLHYPWNDFVEATRALVWMPPVAGYGTRSFAVAEGAARAPSAAGDEVRTGDTWMENAALRIEADARGIITLATADGARRISPLISIESTSDAGDLYTPSLRGAPRVAELSNPRLHLRGPLRATLIVQWRVESHDALRRTTADVASGTLTLTLDSGSRFVRIDVAGDNGIHDHRLRLRVATDVGGAAVFADAAFGPVRREPIVAPAGSAEIPPPTAPLARYVTLASSDRGATLYSDGLGEYEALGDGAVALTLLRAVGELSRNDLPERPGHAGWPAKTPEAQEAGAFEARFALLLHGARDDAAIAEIERAADDVLHPLTGYTVRSTLALPAATSGATLEGDGLALSAIKPSEDGRWLVLRCVNLTGSEIRGGWSVGAWGPGATIREARASRLDETPGELVGIQDSFIAFTAPARAIVTLLVR
jgi:2-O-(6-phospho-alpha-D-mannosyl)-D-glycerate hydrolase